MICYGLFIYDRVFAKNDNSKMMFTVKIQFTVKCIMIVAHIKPVHEIRHVVNSRREAITGYHFLEAGHVWPILPDEIDHLLLSFRVRPVFEYIKMLHIPAHYPYIG